MRQLVLFLLKIENLRTDAPYKKSRRVRQLVLLALKMDNLELTHPTISVKFPINQGFTVGGLTAVICE